MTLSGKSAWGGSFRLVFSSVSRCFESAFTAFAGGEIADHLEVGVCHRQDDQLSDALHGFNGHWHLAAVPGRDHQRALVVGID